MRLNLVLKQLANNSQSIYKVPTDLMLLSSSLTIDKLPRNPIADSADISESKLWDTYFDSFLPANFSDNERSTLLRWLNKHAKVNLIQLETSITLIDQLNFGANPGFGEVKNSKPKCDKATLCGDFLRLAHLTKGSIDNPHLEASISFRIHGFSITFYMTRLDYPIIYTMTELGKTKFPQSLNDISTFWCLQIMRLTSSDNQCFLSSLQAEPFSLAC
ncbi:hypothetical protein F4703DRAFT_1825554 [Phycomyces blakesleeanus]